VPAMTRILLIDDHSLFREAIARLLGGEPDFQVVGECATVEEGLSLLPEANADVVLLDINLGLQQGGAFLNLAWAQGFLGKILVVTAGVGEREAAWLLKHGCSGIFLKSEPLASLVDQVRNVVRNSSGPDVESMQAVLQRVEDSASAVQRPLTIRESKVLRYVCEGLANKEVAQRMGVSEYSVKSFLQQLFAKTGARSRAQLVTFAIERYWDQLGQ